MLQFFLQMFSSRDLTDVSEDVAHNSLQMWSSRDLTDVTLVSDDVFPHRFCRPKTGCRTLLKINFQWAGSKEIWPMET